MVEVRYYSDFLCIAAFGYFPWVHFVWPLPQFSPSSKLGGRGQFASSKVNSSQTHQFSSIDLLYFISQSWTFGSIRECRHPGVFWPTNVTRLPRGLHTTGYFQTVLSGKIQQPHARKWLLSLEFWSKIAQWSRPYPARGWQMVAQVSSFGGLLALPNLLQSFGSGPLLAFLWALTPVGPARTWKPSRQLVSLPPLVGARPITCSNYFLSAWLGL